MIYLGSDHRGFWLKEKIKLWLRQWQLPFEDLGPEKLLKDDDYPLIAHAAARLVAAHSDAAVAILICGSGVGVSIVANKVAGIRAGLGFSGQQIKAARRDDDINVLALPADFLSAKKAQKIVRIFLETEFVDLPRRRRRLKQINEIEKNG